MKNVNVSELQEVVKKLYHLSEQNKKHISLFVWGAPGVGKSAGVRQAAQDLEIGFIDLRVAQMNPVDMRGLPAINKTGESAKWLIPDFFPKEGKGILFLDELNLAPASVMNAAYQLILDRALGDYKMPDGWIIVAAGNRSEDTPNITKMPPPLANRFIHVQIDKPDFDEWRIWAVNKGGVHEQVVTFLSKMPQHLYKAPTIADKAWASPRSWEFASTLHSMGETIDSAVGAGVASEFTAFLKVYSKIPDIDAILEGKKKVEVPKNTELDVIWATCMSIIYKAQPKHWDNVYDYIDRLPKEFTTLVITILDAKSPEWKKTIVYSKQFAKFCKENPALFGE